MHDKRALAPLGDAAFVSGYVAAALQSYGRRDSLAALLDDLDAEHAAPDTDAITWGRQALGFDAP